MKTTARAVMLASMIAPATAFASSEPGRHDRAHRALRDTRRDDGAMQRVAGVARYEWLLRDRARFRRIGFCP